jgi:hypothetical protein
MLPPTSRRVELASADQWNENIRRETDASVMSLHEATPDAIGDRLRELEAEWDVERRLQANASSLVMAGVALGYFIDRRFLLLPAAVLGFFAQHALQGWCPPIPLFRRFGVRTVREIERERYALKALRGDFNSVRPGMDDQAVSSAIAAVDR